MTQQTMLTIKNKSEVLYLRQDNILFIQADGKLLQHAEACP